VNDEERFEKLDLMTLARQLVGGRWKTTGIEYDDALQEALLVAWKVVTKYPDKTDLEVRRIANTSIVNRLIDLSRKDKTRKNVDRVIDAWYDLHVRNKDEGSK
jgi:DNA-directed RNA polymerase specialized sigma24 family protein